MLALLSLLSDPLVKYDMFDFEPAATQIMAPLPMSRQQLTGSLRVMGPEVCGSKPHHFW